MEAYPTSTFVLRFLREGQADEIPEVDLKQGTDPSGLPVISADGRTMFLTSRRGDGLQQFDIDAGRITATIPPPPRHHLGSELALDESGRWLLCEGSSRRGGVLLRDVFTSKWVRVLRAPNELYGHKPIISRGAHWAASVSQRNVQPSAATSSVPPAGLPPQFKHDLLIWDISANTRVGDGAATTPVSGN